MKSPGWLEPNHRILVVDDNAAIHDDLRKILLGEGEAQANLLEDEELLFGAKPEAATMFEIDSAYQGQEGLSKLEQSLAEGRPYALAFVDVRMPPGWDGIETIAHLWKTYPQLQVVICTAYSDYSWKDMQRQLGPSENMLILKKPFDNIEVIQLAHALTRKWLLNNQAQARLEDLDQMVAKRTAELQAANERIRKQFEEKAAAEVAFRTVFESSPIGITLQDLAGRYVDVNRAMEELLGAPKASLIGRHPAESGWIGGNEHSAVFQAAIEGDQGIDAYDLTYWNPNRGKQAALLWARKVLIGGKGYCLCFVLDITRRKEMEEELVRARLDADAAARAKSQFLANMSHEIRTPLNGILGLSCLMEEESIPDEVRPMMSLIRTSGEVLRRVLDDILDFSKIDSGKLELVEEPFDLCESLRWSFELFHDAALEKNLQYRLHLDSRLPAWVSGDATRLRQVAANLMGNAVKFTHHGSIDLEAHLVEMAPPAEAAPRHTIRVAVRDTGIGIPEGRIDRLFQPFSQVDAATNRSYGGTGLGLAICRRLVEMLGGTIRVESAVGVGSTFEFTFTAGAVASQVGPRKTEAKRTSFPGLKVLVAEDNKINQKVTSRLLEKMGCQVDLAADGAQAIRNLETSPYDVVLMDLGMPEVDGMEATRRIRKMAGMQSSIPILALTASASGEVRSQCLEAGMNDFLSKPMELEALRRALERWGHPQEAAKEPTPVTQPVA
jgi:PAS domain S-box-containing protein